MAATRRPRWGLGGRAILRFPPAARRPKLDSTTGSAGPPQRDAAEQISTLANWLSGKTSAHIKVSCYTLQTTIAQFLVLFRTLQDSAHPMPAITLSILRPDLTRPLSLWNPEDPSDRAYWIAQRKAIDLSREVIGMLRQNYPQVRFDERLGRFDPCIKTIIVDNEHAFLGLYVIKPHTLELAEPTTALDYIGSDTKMVEIDRQSVGALFDEIVNWFDQTWTAHSPKLAGSPPQGHGIGAYD